MRRVLYIAAKDLRQVFSDRKVLLFLLVMPIAFTWFMGTLFTSQTQDDSRLPVGVVLPDATDDGVIASLSSLLGATLGIRPEFLPGDTYESLEEAIRSGDLAGAIIVPDTFSDALLLGEPEPFEIIADATAEGDAVREAAFLVGTRLGLAYQAARVATDLDWEQGEPSEALRRADLQDSMAQAVQHWDDASVTVQMVAGPSDAVPMGYAQASPGILVQFAILGLVSSSTVLVVERTTGTLRRMLTTPVHRSEIVAGHVLASGLIVWAQELLLILFAQWVLGVDYFSAPLAILAVMLALCTFCACLGLLIGVVARGEDQAVVLSLLAMFVMCSLGGAWYPLEATGETFSSVGHLTPIAWAMEGFQNVIIRGQGLASALIPSAVLLAWAALCFGVAARRLRAA